MSTATVTTPAPASTPAVPEVTAAQVRGFHQEQGKQISGKIKASHVTAYLMARPAKTREILVAKTDWRGSRGRLPVKTVQEVAEQLLADLK